MEKTDWKRSRLADRGALVLGAIIGACAAC